MWLKICLFSCFIPFFISSFHFSPKKVVVGFAFQKDALGTKLSAYWEHWNWSLHEFLSLIPNLVFNFSLFFHDEQRSSQPRTGYNSNWTSTSLWKALRTNPTVSCISGALSLCEELELKPDSALPTLVWLRTLAEFLLEMCLLISKPSLYPWTLLWTYLYSCVLPELEWSLHFPQYMAVFLPLSLPCFTLTSHDYFLLYSSSNSLYGVLQIK